jgi:hypothetical protein
MCIGRIRLRNSAAPRESLLRIDRIRAAGYSGAMPRAEFSSHFAPGDWVRHPERPEWGLGRVQSALGARLTATFENAGKQSINAEIVTLVRVQPPQREENW